MLQFLILLTLIFFIECAVGIVAFLHRDQVRTWLTLVHALWCSVCLNDGFQFKNTIKTSHALWGHLLTVSCMRITQLHANTLPATAQGIKEKTSEKRLGVKRFHFMCVSKDLKWKIGGRGEEILVGGREERLHYCYPAKTAVSPRTSPLGTFCKKERLRLSDRNPILMT